MARSDDAKRAEALQKIAELQAQIDASSGAELDTLKEKLQKEQALVTLLEKAEGYHQRSVEDAKTLLKIYEDQKDTLKGGAVYREQAIETNERILRQAEQDVKDGKMKLGAFEQLERSLERQNGLHRSKNRLASEFLSTQKEQNQLAADFGDSLGKAATVYQTSFGAAKIKDLTKALQGGTTSLAEFGSSLAVSFSDSMIDNMIGVVFQAYDAENAFRKATGASEEMARSMTNAYENVRETGASMAEVSAAGQALFGTYTDFTMLSGEMQESLTETSAVMAQLGVANADFAAGIQVSTKMLGQSGIEARATALELTTFAKELGRAPSEMAAEFAKAGPALAKYGDMGVKTFKDLQHISKITGMEMQKVLAITDKFDTFEGAAEQTGKLNAALGGNFVNAMDLMTATDPAERFGMIRDSILDAGLSFDDMSYYQKNFYKDTLGLADVGDLAMMLSGDMDNLAGATDATAESLIEQKEAAQGVQDLQTQMKALMASMVPIMTPFIGLIKFLVGAMTKYKAVMWLILVPLLAYKAVMLAATIIQSIQNAKTAFGIPIKTADAAATKLQEEAQEGLNDETEGGAGPMESLGEKASKAAKGLLAVGAAALMIGAGIGLAAWGLAQMVAAFKGLGDAAWPAVAGIIGFTVAFGLLMLGLVALVLGPQAAVTAAAIGVLLAVGAAALMMGGGIALAAVGFAQFLGAFSGFDPSALMAFSMAMIPLGFAVMLLGNPIALFGIMNLVLLGGAVALIGQFGGGFEQFLGALSGFDAGSAWGSARALGALGLATLLFGNPLATLGIMNITLLAGAFTLLGASIALVGMSAAESFERISEAVDNIPTAKTIAVTGMMAASAAAAAVTAPAQMIAAAVGGATGGGGATQTVRQPISLTLNGKALEDFVLEVIGKEIIAINVV